MDNGKNLFYTPEYAKTGDVIPFYNEKERRFDNFYLKNWNPDAPRERVVYGWHRISTTDNRYYTELPTGIHGGTGSVIRVGETYHLFYCTFDANPPAQWVRHAVSTDLEHWRDIPEDKFGADGVIYKTSDWRDPFVFWNEEEKKWWMLLAARENAPTERNGCVALCASDDLSRWEYRKPLYAPRKNQAANECPDLFRMGDWYYLVYSNYTDGFCTYYRMARSLNGPWLTPAVDTFDGRAFYAAKTGFDGKNHYVYGWNPTRGEDGWKFDPAKDYGRNYRSWNWGGSIIVHRIVQHEDGSLGVCPIESVSGAFAEYGGMKLQPLTGEWAALKEGASCRWEDGYSCVLGGEIPEICCMKTKLQYHGENAVFGIALHVDEDMAEGYYLAFEPWHRRIQFRSGLRMNEEGGKMFPYAVEMERPLKLREREDVEIELYVQDTIGLLYVNRDLAFSFRMYDQKPGRFGFFVENGALDIKAPVLGEQQAQTKEETRNV
ncbi:MAG: family 43 glycosylhydrolase [Lachnospiraceae bacterium]|nr:family 43 glycosylhydrolase [Lachnospiraceae bacterium]